VGRQGGVDDVVCVYEVCICDVLRMCLCL